MNSQLQVVTALLPAPFYEDQGALLVADGPEVLAPSAEALVAALVVAGDRGLHVGHATAQRVAAWAGSLGRLGARSRGRLLVALVMAEHPGEVVDRAVRTGVFSGLLPDLDRMLEMPKGAGRYKNVYQHTLQVLAATPADPVTRLAALLHDVAKPDTLVIEDGQARFPNHDLLGADRATRRLRALKFDEDVVDAVATLVRLHLRANSYEPDWTDSAVRRLHLDAGDQWERLLDLSYADVTSAREAAVARARRRVYELAEHARSLDVPIEVSPLDGNVLMERFRRGPGRWIGDVKRHLVEMVREGRLDPDDHAAAWRAAEACLNNLPADVPLSPKLD